MHDLDFSKGWLRGFFDGEGHVNIRDHILVFSNTDTSLIESLESHLLVLGFRYRSYWTHRPPRAPVCRVVIGRRDDVRRFIELIGSSSETKRRQMDRVCAYFDANPMPNGRWSPVAIDADSVGEMIESGLNYQQIAATAGCSRSTVYHRLKHAGRTSNHRMGPPPTREELVQLYEVEQRSIREIGQLLGYKGTAIARVLKRHNIQARRAHRYNR